MSLTDSLRYALKGSAVSSRSYIHKVSPTNGSTFTYGGVTRLDIPSGMRSVRTLRTCVSIATHSVVLSVPTGTPIWIPARRGSSFSSRLFLRRQQVRRRRLPR